LHLTIGVLILTAATWLFSALAEDVRNGDPWTAVDARFSQWLHLQASRPLTTLMLLVTNVHSTLGVSVMTFAISFYLVRRRMRDWAFTLFVTVYIGMLLNGILKLVFQRARPHFENAILTLSGYSFPSGHTMMATVFYGTLIAIVIDQCRDWRWRTAALIVAVFLIVLVGLSRIYLGVHYLTDVLGAIVEGFAWLTVCLTAALMQRQKAEVRKR